ncbi:hypothetical protein EZL74_12890 [Flavobacterium silvisoli]|uniref:Uncharacterized protein n=1 Tax=Flavobacterium silvisoli TaxID=2529433 RepID=A0A4V2L415_9FLAO|nr:hypothetical protein [Flavobacterium silvisoli]TBX64779.1 hypothetical protein EZL74_12890 [Flavobacterium silvisoli]
MKSEIWNKENGLKAFTTGFTIEEIKLFDIECEEFLKEVIRQSAFLNNTFKTDVNDLKKANWLILNDITTSLYDCHQNMVDGNIRIASRVFRDTMENMHILELLNKSQKEKYLKNWYENEVISNSEYREWIKKEKSIELSELNRDVYRQYSKYAHRTYEAIYESYSQDIDSTIRFRLKLSRENPSDLKILSEYYSHLSYFIINTTLNYSDYNVLNRIQMSIISDLVVR